LPSSSLPNPQPSVRESSDAATVQWRVTEDRGVLWARRRTSPTHLVGDAKLRHHRSASHVALPLPTRVPAAAPCVSFATPSPQRQFTSRMRGVRWSNARCVKRPCPPSNTDNTPHTRTHTRWANTSAPKRDVKTSSAVKPSALLLIAPSAWSPPPELRRCSCVPPRTGTQWTLALMGVACGTHGPPPHIHRGLYDRGSSHHPTHLPTPLGP